MIVFVALLGLITLLGVQKRKRRAISFKRDDNYSKRNICAVHFFNTQL